MPLDSIKTEGLLRLALRGEVVERTGRFQPKRASYGSRSSRSLEYKVKTWPRSLMRLIGIQDQVGTIEKGKRADLLLIEGNPLRRIDLLRDRSRIMGVMQSGRFVAGPLSKT